MLPSDVSWTNWNKLFLDTSVWEAPVRHVLSDLGFSVSSIEAEFPGTSAVFEVQCGIRSLIVKFFPPMAHRDFIAERSVYRALSPAPPLPIPRLVATGTLHDAIDWPYLVVEKNLGTAVRDLRDQLSQDDLVDIAEQVGVHLRALHSADRNRVPELNRSIAEWKAGARSRLQAVPEELARVATPEGKPLLPASTLAEVTDFLRSMGTAVISSMTEDDLSLIHADVTEDHVLVMPESAQTPRKYRVETIFDFGDAEVAPVYYEWIPVWFSLLRQNRGAFEALLERHREESHLGLRPGHRHARFSERNILLTFTFVHRFSAAIVKETLSREYEPLGKLSSFSDLAEVLWPV